MKSRFECLPCLMTQALNSARLATADENMHREIMNRASDWSKEADLSCSPAEISTRIYRIVSEVTGIADPYSEIKKETNNEALSMAVDLRQILEESSDSLSTGLHLAAAGNIIDMGIGHKYNIRHDVMEILETAFAIDSTENFREELKSGYRLLYLGDNSGEIVFDMLLVEILQKMGADITFAVKSGPIINDVLGSDADDVGLSELVPIIETGSDDIGINFERASSEFLDAFDRADCIIAKGHGNFESCEGRPGNIYFLLKAKCDVVAGELGVARGDIVFKHRVV